MRDDARAGGTGGKPVLRERTLPFSVQDLANQRITVMGLGHFGGGVAAARWLARQGAHVTATDAQPAEKLEASVRQLDGLDVTLKLGGHEERDFTEADLVVASPAVPPNNAYLQRARAAGVPVTTEICLLIERLPTQLVFGVTGTKGKSTTATLLAKMLGGWQPIDREKAGRLRATRSDLIDLAHKQHRNVWLGGNIGGSLLDKLGQMSPRDFVVLELSSYMLHYLGQRKWSPHVAVVTMVGSDHLAWHGTSEAYLEAKQNLVRHQTAKDFSVLPSFSKLGRAFKKHTAAQVVEYGKRAHLPEAFAPRLMGKHNRYNERAAYAAAALVGVYPDQAAAEVAGFAGLPHRLELVAEDERGVKYVNDSIATIPEAAAAACEAFPAGSVVQIVGGSDKGLDTGAMAKTLADRCRVVLCIGATGQAVAQQIGEKAIACGDLPTAMTKARELSQPGEVVLLSPGFASYDQFDNFEHRGREFTTEARRHGG